MGLRVYLKYGDEYMNERHWDLFRNIIAGSRGRRNHLIYRVFAALVEELDIDGLDESGMITEIERWANERIRCGHRSAGSTVNIRDPVPVSEANNVKTVMDADTYPTGVSDTKSMIQSAKAPPEHETDKSQPQTKTVMTFNSSIFSGVNKSSFTDL